MIQYRKTWQNTARIARIIDNMAYLQGFHAVGMLHNYHGAEMALSTAAGDNDRGLSRRNRRFTRSFLHFNGCAVGAVGVLRTSPSTSVLAGTDHGRGGLGFISMPAPYFFTETWSWSA